jgi:hypothetical protein
MALVADRQASRVPKKSSTWSRPGSRLRWGCGPARGRWSCRRMGLTRFDGHPPSGVLPWEDVHHGDHGTQAASRAPVVHP